VGGIQVYHRDSEIAEEDFILIQSGDGDWIRNFFPSGLKPSIFDRSGTYKEHCSERTETFLFVPGSSRDKQKNLPLCPRRLVKMLFWTNMLFY
jgi:hypothetical protein